MRYMTLLLFRGLYPIAASSNRLGQHDLQLRQFRGLTGRMVLDFHALRIAPGGRNEASQSR